jgi:hypothetical protein
METGYLRRKWTFSEALARGLNRKGQRSGSECPNRYGSAANKGKREEVHMMSPMLQRLANTWFLPLTLLIMSPVIIYEKWHERNPSAGLETAHEN